MLMIHESLMQFKALIAANNHKIYNLLLSKASVYYVYILSWKKVISFTLFVLLCALKQP